MLCENVFCVYQKDDGCILDEVRLDIQGKCVECMYIDVAEGILNKSKRELLERYEQEV